MANEMVPGEGMSAASPRKGSIGERRNSLTPDAFGDE